MSDIRWNTSGQALVISMSFNNGKLVVEVDIKPNVQKGLLETVAVRTQKGADLCSEDRTQIEVTALRELMAWFKKRLQKPREWVRVSSLEERIEIAFIHTLDTYDPGLLDRITPLSFADLSMINTLSRKISDGYAEEKNVQGKSASWQEVKRRVLKDWQKETPTGDDLRDFYSSVIARANGWKWDRVPRTIYERAEKLKPGFYLLFRLQ